MAKKRGRKSGKRRSAAQRAATARMLAARGVVKQKRRGKRRGSKKARRYTRRSGGFARRMNLGGVMPMLKGAAVGATGALAVDIAMGYAGRVLPANLASPMSADGSPNLAYHATKGALAIATGMLAGKVISPHTAAKMAEGSLIVTLHDAAKALIPSGSVALGYASPALVTAKNVSRIAEYTRRAAPLRERALGEYVRRG